MMQREPKIKPPRMTEKQVGVLKALARRNDDGSRLDIYQLIDKVAPGTTRGAMMTTLQHMAMHGLIEESEKVIRRGKRIRTFIPTDTGLALLRPFLNAGVNLNNLSYP